MKLYLIFGSEKAVNRRSEEHRQKELYKIFNDKIKAEEYLKECKAEEPKLRFEIEEWEITE